MPSNVEAEQALLGTILLDGTTLASINNFQTKMLYLEKHQWILDAARAARRDNGAVDILTVSTQLEQTGKLEDVGGKSYLSALLGAVPGTLNTQVYARMVEEAFLARSLIYTGTTIAELGYTAGEFRAKYAEAMKSLQELREFSIGDLFTTFDIPAAAYGDELLDNLDNPREVIGIPTLLPEYDRVLGGLTTGLRIIAGRPSVGKTQYLLSLALNVALQNKRVVIVTLEMTQAQIIERFISFLSGISVLDIRRRGVLRAGELYLFSDDEKERLRYAVQIVKNLPFIVNNEYAPIVEYRDELVGKFSELKLDALIYDYLQLSDEGGENQNIRLGNASRNLKLMADELEISVIAGSQVGRAVEKTDLKRVALSDLRESGKIEENADTVEGIYRPDYYARGDVPRTHIFESDLLKDRQTGKAPFTFKFGMNPNTGRIEPEVRQEWFEYA